MNTVLITGSCGLIGSESVRFFSRQFDNVVGVDNDMRRKFFGDDASTAWNRRRIEEEIANYIHVDMDIRDQVGMEQVFKEHGRDIRLIVHTAAQPSHDWAIKDPFTDFTVNANGTLVLLEMARKYCPSSVFIHCSTNKVYGDTPNRLPLEELETRWEVAAHHPYFSHGIDESMSLDQTKHSLFGASKVAADILVQEYGRYFDMKTACFRGGCLTGPMHSGTELHGFLSYLMKCAITGTRYTIYGYKGKQVRDNIHASDLISMFDHFYRSPRCGEVYNAGGSRFSNCSMLEAIKICEEITGKGMNYVYSETNRVGDHIWWVSDVRKFQLHYPGWKFRYSARDILQEIHEGVMERLRVEADTIA